MSFTPIVLCSIFCQHNVPKPISDLLYLLLDSLNLCIELINKVEESKVLILNCKYIGKEGGRGREGKTEEKDR